MTGLQRAPVLARIRDHLKSSLCQQRGPTSRTPLHTCQIEIVCTAYWSLRQVSGETSEWWQIAGVTDGLANDAQALALPPAYGPAKGNARGPQEASTATSTTQAARPRPNSSCS
ncbi:hypothetical protein E2P81_ATG10326 [Venturia nashicola]|nr:hypothetical protein E2P81_ATG10326 [Venturia nashicola]